MKLRAMLVCAAIGGLMAGTAWTARQVLHPPSLNVIDADYWDVIGTELTSVNLVGIDGNEVTVPLDGDHLICFLDPECEACPPVYPALIEASRTLPVLVLLRPGVQSAADFLADSGLHQVTAAYDEGAIGRQLQIVGAPTVAFVSRRQVVTAATGSQSSQRVIQFALDQEKGG